MKSHHIVLAGASLALMAASCGRREAPRDYIFSCDDYTVYTDSVVQGEFTARALSPLEIVTDYRSPDDAGASRKARFRFSINSRDNEMDASLSHTALIGVPGDTVVYMFGSTAADPVESDAANDTLPRNTPWTVRVDMRPMLRAFARDGHYVTPTGDIIDADDFKGVWLAGSVEPLSWDFENLYGKHDRQLKDRGDSIFEVTLNMNPPSPRTADPTGWRISAPDERFPRYESSQTLVDACYNMAIADIASDQRPDSTYRAGREWDGVWTRDVAYSIYLSLAYLDPERSKNSLRAKVKNGRIVQDTGTGGAWPVSSDRVVWAIAAWEIYNVTGDRQWLAEAFDVIEASLADDMAVVWDPAQALMHGEQSYLDWREQTYPRWMQPADIFGSMCLGTNAVFARAFEIAAEMAGILGRDGKATYTDMHNKIARSINDNLWIPNLGYYSEYLYCQPYPIQSQATDNLGQSLAVIFDIASDEMASSLVGNTPVTAWGTPSVWPQQPDIRPYHNDAVWPFVQAYWNLAAAKTRNSDALLAGMAAIWRAAALFGTNKELFVAHNGDYRGTAVNSDAQLWSAAGNAAMVFRVLAGMEFKPDGIEFHPVVPEIFSGDKKISGFRYRGAELHVTVSGTGDKIASFTIDGKPADGFTFPATLTGRHTVEITMANNRIKPRKSNLTSQAWMPHTPVVKWESPRQARILHSGPSLAYQVFINGVFEQQIQTDTYNLYDAPGFTAINFVPVSDERLLGFSPRPYFFLPAGSERILEAEDFATPGTDFIADKAKARRFVELTTDRNTSVTFKINVTAAGDWWADLRYANGSGPINTDSKCAIRSLIVNGERAGAIVMPQRGIGEWLSTGYSNMLPVSLKAGENTLTVEYITPSDINMNGEVNTALIDHMRLIKK